MPSTVAVEAPPAGRGNTGACVGGTTRLAIVAVVVAVVDTVEASDLEVLVSVRGAGDVDLVVVMVVEVDALPVCVDVSRGVVVKDGHVDVPVQLRVANVVVNFER